MQVSSRARFLNAVKWFSLFGLLANVGVGATTAQLAPKADAADQLAQAWALVSSLDGVPSLGDAKAPVVIVEFGDYECPYCGMHAKQVLPQILTNYVKTGKVRYFFKDAPVEVMHPQSLKAAQAAVCSGKQGKYWEMHDRLFGNQKALALTDIFVSAATLELDRQKFEKCMNDERDLLQIRNSLKEGLKLGLRGTPTFFIASLAAEKAGTTNMRMLSGFQSYDAFKQVLDQLLSNNQKVEVH
jgi:protein-disulfide isomerase